MGSQAASAFLNANALGAVVGKADGRLPAGLAHLFHIGLSHKIAAIGAAGIVGLIVAGGIYLYGAALQERYRTIASDAREIAASGARLSAALLEARADEKSYILRKDERYAKSHGEISKEIAGHFDALKRRLAAAGHAEISDQVDGVRSGFDAYGAHFAALVDGQRKIGLDENSGLNGALRAAVHAIESKLKEYDEPRLSASMLMMRRHEKDFMLRHDPKYGEDLRRQAGAFALMLDSASIPANAKSDIAQKLAAYQRDFFAWMEGWKATAQAESAMMDAFRALEPRLAAFTGAVARVYTQAEADSRGVIAATTLRIQIALVVIVVAVGLLAFYVGRSVSRPLAAMTGVMGALARGQNDVDVPGAERQDEIGQMARAVQVFRNAAIEKIRLEAQATEERTRVEHERRRNEHLQSSAAEEQAKVVASLASGLKSLSGGDLTFRLGDSFPETYKQIRDDFNTAIAQLQETIGAIAISTRELASTAAEISTSTTDLSQRTEEQAASLEETSAAMEQISATVKTNAEHAQQAHQFGTGTREVADRGGEVVAQAVKAMSRIEESSRRISDIIGVIDEIARQTNLLALNAAVEAARAGEAGRGFAVVASEVRSLAQRSSQAAKDINDLISNSSGQVQEGVELVNRAGASLTEIVDSIKKVAEIVSDIASASGEQSTGIDQVTTALAQMDEVTQQNSALVEQNASAAWALEQQSRAMDARVGFFRLGDRSAAAATRPSAAASPGLVAAAPRRPRAPARPSGATAMSEPRPAAKRPAAASATRRDGIWDGEWGLIGSKA